MKKTILIFFILLSIKTNAQVIQVTNYPNANGYLEGGFKLSQNNLIYQNFSNTNGYHLLMYKGNTLVTTDLGTIYGAICNSADIYNGNVVWMVNNATSGSTDIKYFNGSNISTLAANAQYPSIYKNFIAYYVLNYPNNLIKIFNGSSTISANTSTGNIFPVTDVCQNKAIFEDGNGFYLFEGNTNSISTISTAHIGFYKISEDAVLYLNDTTVSSCVNKLYLYKQGNSIQLNTNSVKLTNIPCLMANADIDSNKAVWVEINQGALGGSDVFYYDGNTTNHLVSATDQNIIYSSPKVSGNNVIWVCTDNNYSPSITYLHYYNGITIKKLNFVNTNHSIYFNHNAPQLSGNNMAWIEYNPIDGSDNLYMADITTLPEMTLNVNKNIISNINIKVYPNPVSDKLKIDIQNVNNLKSTIISVYDTQGKLLLQQTITKQQTELNISEFAKGIYVVKVNNDKNTMVSKFVKE
jgi:hypothetical protein